MTRRHYDLAFVTFDFWGVTKAAAKNYGQECTKLAHIHLLEAALRWLS